MIQWTLAIKDTDRANFRYNKGIILVPKLLVFVYLVVFCKPAIWQKFWCGEVFHWAQGVCSTESSLYWLIVLYVRWWCGVYLCFWCVYGGPSLWRGPLDLEGCLVVPVLGFLLCRDIHVSKQTNKQTRNLTCPGHGCPHLTLSVIHTILFKLSCGNQLAYNELWPLTCGLRIRT